MKGPIEFQAPWVQQRILNEGTREQLIEWLCWNDPNGVYTDEDAEVEGCVLLTIDEARRIMRSQLSR